MRKILYLLGEPLDIQTLYEQSIYIVLRFKNGGVRKDMTGFDADLAVWLYQGTNVITGSTQDGAITFASTANDAILDEMRIFIDFIGTNTTCPAPYSYNYRLNIEKDNIDTFALNGKFVMLDVAPDDFEISNAQPSTVTFTQSSVTISAQTIDAVQLRDESLAFRNQAEVFKNSASGSATIATQQATIATAKANEAKTLGFQGTWNASTNTPTLTTMPDPSLADGSHYIVDVAGTQSVTGSSVTFQEKDQLMKSGTVWKRIANGNRLDKAGDVLITNKQDGDIIQYDSSVGLYKNANLAGESGSSPKKVMSQKAVLELTNENKALFRTILQPPINFEKFTTETGATVTYANGVVTAAHSNTFLVANSVEELREIEFSYNKLWYCVGFGTDGNALIVSTSATAGSLGKVRKITAGGAVSDIVTGVLPTTEIPTNATRIRVNTENGIITISYTIDNTNWTIWGAVAISAITGYSTKKLGFLSYVGYTDKTATVYSFKRVDTIKHTLALSDVEETTSVDSKFLLIGGGVDGIQKLPKSNAKQALGFVTQTEIDTAKALFSLNAQPSISFEKFTSEGSTASVTYVNGVITATHTSGYMAGFMIASSVEELREIIVSNNRPWLCLGYDSTGKAIIVSTNEDNTGKVRSIATTGELTGLIQAFPTTRIPAEATRVKINITTSIIISYTLDNVSWTVWGSATLASFTNYSTKKLGFLSYVGYPTPRILTVYSHKRAEIEDTSYSLVLDGVEETTNDTDKWYLLGGGTKGLQKFKKPTITPINYGKIEYLGDSIVEQGVTTIANFYSGIATVYNNGHSGYCYGVGGAGTLNNTTFLNSLIAHAPNFVFLQAGTNDFGNSVAIGLSDSSNVNEMCGGLNAIISTIQTALPNCRIIISTPSPRYYTGSTQFQANGLGKYYVEYVDAIIAVASRHSIIVQDRWRKMGVNQFNKTTFTSDGLHLTAAGYKRMLDADLALLKTLV